MKKLIPVLATALVASASVNAENFYGSFSGGIPSYNQWNDHEVHLAVQPATGDSVGQFDIYHGITAGIADYAHWEQPLRAVNKSSSSSRVNIYGNFTEGVPDYAQWQ